MGARPDMITPLLPVWLGLVWENKSIQVTKVGQAVDLLKMGGSADNDIAKLYAALLAAKLNIKDGCPSSVIDETVMAADAFLARHDLRDGKNLTAADKQQLQDWLTKLANYNNENI
jgi:hypothetical protein